MRCYRVKLVVLRLMGDDGLLEEELNERPDCMRWTEAKLPEGNFEGDLIFSTIVTVFGDLYPSSFSRRKSRIAGRFFIAPDTIWANILGLEVFFFFFLFFLIPPIIL